MKKTLICFFDGVIFPELFLIILVLHLTIASIFYFNFFVNNKSVPLTNILTINTLNKENKLTEIKCNNSICDLTVEKDTFKGLIVDKAEFSENSGHAG